MAKDAPKQKSWLSSVKDWLITNEVPRAAPGEEVSRFSNVSTGIGSWNMYSHSKNRSLAQKNLAKKQVDWDCETKASS
ncbi:hypothetical protein DL89DRAFT_266488 [Linderina pennispora]|uniref:Uncharacterized protein n=1 Tax=Linderina pennispora TaxID=61395 RepID=A0A1Y1WDQ8_9FUNG|nr:uncharacterized protein DL89DRAFT_266488 [Linderina pennispora]ORX71468.1 hypothetical protein DL89DRAFT_266488 [Linderina pennispora]